MQWRLSTNQPELLPSTSLPPLVMFQGDRCQWEVKFAFFFRSKKRVEHISGDKKNARKRAWMGTKKNARKRAWRIVTCCTAVFQDSGWVSVKCYDPSFPGAAHRHTSLWGHRLTPVAGTPLQLLRIPLAPVADPIEFSRLEMCRCSHTHTWSP